MLGAYDGRAWIDWSWVGDHGDEITARLREHATLTILSMLVGVALAFPLALASVSRRRLRGVVLATTGMLYTVPSLAAFALLLPYTGLSRATAVIPLSTYTLLILIRNIVAGLDSVPEDVRDAAVGMGYSPVRKLLQIDLPLALPAIFAGLRIAAVTVIGLIPVAALIGQGGLGLMIRDGFNRDFRTPLTVATVLTVAFAVLVDAVLMLTQRALTPWARRGAGR